MSLHDICQSLILCRAMALGRGQENVHATVDMKETCVMSVPTCTLKSKMKILNPNVQVSMSSTNSC